MHKESSALCQCLVDIDAIKVRILCQVETVISLLRGGSHILLRQVNKALHFLGSFLSDRAKPEDFL